MQTRRSLSSLPPFPIWPFQEGGFPACGRPLDASPRLGDGLPTEARVLRVELKPEGQLALKIKSRSNTGPTGGIPSLKTNAMVHWKSPAEGHLAKMLECEPMVSYFGSQPGTVYYTLDGVEVHRHIPDSLCRGGPYPILWEVKSERDTWREDIALRNALMASGLPALGFSYRVALAEDLRREPRLGNLKQVRRLGRQALRPAEREVARQFFAREPSVKWSDIDALRLGPLTPAVVCRLVLEGVLWLNLDHVLGRGTAVMSMAYAVQEARRG